MQRILLIEDDHELGTQLVEHLQQAGYATEWRTHGSPLAADDAQTMALVILDLMLPGSDGFAILADLRTHAEVPVLVLSARSDTPDKVRALQLGADDYMTKPFWPEELLERVRARLRRPNLRPTDALALGPLRIDLHGRSLTMHARPVELTRVEYDLLLALARRPGKTLTRKWLVQHVLDRERDGGERTLDVHVSRIRRKLGADHRVETVWGIGYRLAAGDEP